MATGLHQNMDWTSCLTTVLQVIVSDPVSLESEMTIKFCKLQLYSGRRKEGGKRKGKISYSLSVCRKWDRTV